MVNGVDVKVRICAAEKLIGTESEKWADSPQASIKLKYNRRR